MSSLDSLMSRSYAAKGVVGQIGTDEPVAIRIKAKAAAGVITSVITITGTSIEAISANGGTETWDFATYSTIGLLIDKINASVYWECKVLDALRSYATATQFINGTITASTTEGVVYYDVLVDTSAAKYFAYRLTIDRTVGQDKPKGSHRVHLREFIYDFNALGNVTADDVQIWETNGGVETQLFGQLSVAGSAQTFNWASGEASITAADGNDLVVLIVDDTTLADHAENYLRIVGKLE